MGPDQIWDKIDAPGLLICKNNMKLFSKVSFPQQAKEDN